MGRAGPLDRTLKRLRKEGWEADQVERWLMIPGQKFASKRKDYIGIIDVIAYKGDITLGVQSTTGSGNFSSHLGKALTEPRLKTWLSGRDRRFEIWCWRKIGKKGKRKLWKVRRQEILHDELCSND